MKTVIKRSLLSVLIVPMLALGVSAALQVVVGQSTVNAQTSKITEGIEATGNDDNVNTDLPGLITIVVNTLLIIVGAVAVIMLIWGGFKYITSAGDASAVSSAKNTILYAVIGIIVAVLAYAIVNWVISTVTGQTT
jgi:hypothetical protein